MAGAWVDASGMFNCGRYRRHWPMTPPTEGDDTDDVIEALTDLVAERGYLEAPPVEGDDE
jgi:hypothetical protein